MKIVCLTVGKKHDPALAESILMYQKRLNSYVDFSFEYITSSDINNESSEIISKLKVDDQVILLDETGSIINNKDLSDKISNFQNQSVKRLVFVIGGSYGVNDSVKQMSANIVSLSGLVFPHQIARLLLVEQLYRTFNSLAGGKYHHGN